LPGHAIFEAQRVTVAIRELDGMWITWIEGFETLSSDARSVSATNTIGRTPISG